MTENTRDMSLFGYRELELAAELLAHVKEADSNGGLAIEFNPNSGNVFLVDEDYRVWMMSDGKLAEFFSCPECGHEGFRADFVEEKCECAECKRIAKGG